MEDNTRFTPTYTGVSHARLPFRSVYIPVVPCALDGCLSLLELIAKMQYVVNTYQAGIEANHTDIVNLAAELEQAVTDLRAYIDAQDAVTLASALAYADGLDTALRAYVDAQDAATLASAKTYADGLDTALRAYLAEQLALKQDVLTFDQTPTNGSANPVTSDGIYDALALKQDVLTFDTAPTDGSANPVTSDGIYDALALKLNSDAVVDNVLEDDIHPVTSGAVWAQFNARDQHSNVILNFSYDVDTTTLTPSTPNAFNVATAALNADRLVFAVLVVTGTVTAQRADKYYLWLDKFTGANMITFACTDYTLTGTATGWTIS